MNNSLNILLEVGGISLILYLDGKMQDFFEEQNYEKLSTKSFEK